MGREGIEDSYLRGISSVHNRRNSDDNSICASHVSNRITKNIPRTNAYKGTV